MAAGLGALGDDRVDAALLERSRLGHGRCARHDEDAGGLDRCDDLWPGQAEMKADDLRLLLQQHCDMLGADVAGHSLRLWHRAQSLGVVNGLQMPTHRLAGFRGVGGIGPDRIVDVQASVTLLAKAGDVPAGVFRRKTPHADAAKPAGVADGGGERWCGDDAHRRLDDWKSELQSVGKRV
jgi:hypothetical protein